MKTSAAVVASLSVVAMIADVGAASAQPAPPPDYNQPSPPAGQYAPPPPGAENSGATYDERSQQYDRDYADRYSQWAAQYCVDRRNNNTAAGAIIGGVLGAVIGSSVSPRWNRGGGAFAGAVVGGTAGAAIGANSGQAAGCPPGYLVRAGAPAFAYEGGPYDPGVVYGPAWYNPWFFVGGQWVYRPYRYWYWQNHAYWRPGWHAGAYRYRYRPW